MNDRLVVTTIRRARPADGEAVRRIVFGTFEDYDIVPEPEGTDKDVMTFGEHADPIDEFVADIDGEAVGSVMVSPHGDGNGWLSKFFVDSRLRGRGIGRALLAHAVAAARERGYRRLELDTRSFFKEAIHLYESTGWTLSPEAPALGPCDVIYLLDLEGRPLP